MLEIRNLMKVYGNKKVLDNINLSFESNKIYGLLGPNGAGKTTMMKIIANRAFPAKGDVRLNGAIVTENEVIQKNVFYVTEKDKYPKDIKMKDLLKWEARFYENFDIEQAKQLAQLFNLDLNKKTNTLSTGYYTIFKVIVSLASNSEVMILDEPVLGIDSLYRGLFYKVLLEYHQKKKNLILIATHLSDEVEPVLEEVIVIDNGNIIRQAPLKELTKGKRLNDVYVEILKEARNG